MTDFWEIMGRLVTNDKLRKELFDLNLIDAYPVGEHWRARIPAGEYQLFKVGNSFKVAFTKSRHSGRGGNNHYKSIRTILQGYIKYKPFSLMALGSMAYAMTMTNFKELAGEVAKMIHDAVQQGYLTLPNDDLFYIALGAMIVDRVLKQELIDEDNWDLWGFGRLSQGERDILKALLDDNMNATLSKKVDDFCDTGWGQECDVTAAEWNGHFHPVSQLNDGTSILDEADLQ